MFQHKRHRRFSSRVNLCFLQVNNIKVEMGPQNGDKSGSVCTYSRSGEHLPYCNLPNSFRRTPKWCFYLFSCPSCGPLFPLLIQQLLLSHLRWKSSVLFLFFFGIHWNQTEFCILLQGGRTKSSESRTTEWELQILRYLLWWFKI